jgi:Ca2+-binding EF-hand superfamily protein
MKRLVLALAATSLLLASASYAAKGDRQKPTEAAAALLKKYDANANGKIDTDEAATVRSDFATTTDESFKALDKDHDGKLSDTEIAALGGAKKGKKKK